MFWINFEWLVFTKPYNLEADGDTIKLNHTSREFWTDMPPKYQGMAIVKELIMWKDF